VDRSFTADHDGVRVVFGSGAVRRLGDELDRLGVRRVLVVASPGRALEADGLASILGPRSAGVWAHAREHVPVETAEAARAEAALVDADAVVAYGGGSSIGTAKAVALVRDVALAAVPTTYSGSEMTPVYGITDGGRKQTGRDERVRPRLVIYDPSLTVDLPLAVTRTSLFNAMAHAVEALWAPGADRHTERTASEAIELLARSLLQLVRGAHDLEARATALHGAYLAGRLIGSLEMGLHHRICHVLGGSFGLPHSPTHAVVLPHVVRYNAAAAAPAVACAARTLQAEDAAGALFDLAREAGAPTSLAEIGFRPSDIEPAARAVLERPVPNPRRLEVDALVALLAAAHEGKRP
jgi:maleylacetate reductase